MQFTYQAYRSLLSLLREKSGCVMNGSCSIGENAYISTSVIRNQSTIGEDATVGMGAVVIKNVDPGVIVAGNPARSLARKEE